MPVQEYRGPEQNLIWGTPGQPIPDRLALFNH